jgi:hypothetical protein
MNLAISIAEGYLLIVGAMAAIAGISAVVYSIFAAVTGR